MTQPGSGDLLDHVGPWTEAEFLALLEDRRIELLDGELLVSPSARHLHRRLSSRLWAALDTVATPGHEVLEAVNVRVAPGRILIPDIVVVTDPGADVVVSDGSAVAMVVEIVSPGSVAADRAIKPPLYAAAGIGVHLRVELGSSGVAAAVYRLAGGHYVEAVRVQPGELLRLTEPFPVDLDLSRLAATTRPDA